MNLRESVLKAKDSSKTYNARQTFHFISLAFALTVNENVGVIVVDPSVTTFRCFRLTNAFYSDGRIANISQSGEAAEWIAH